MPQSNRYLKYFKTIPKDKWLFISDYAPSNPDRFLEYLEMLPFAVRDIDMQFKQFRINGIL